MANFGKSATLAPAIEMYRADRGAECKLTAPDNTRLTVLYFEWDIHHPSSLDSYRMPPPATILPCFRNGID